jgi:hypothetical protein
MGDSRQAPTPQGPLVLLVEVLEFSGVHVDAHAAPVDLTDPQMNQLVGGGRDGS